MVLTVVALVVTLVTAVPLSADAQQPARVHRIGYLSASPSSTSAPFVEAFREGLRKLGYVESQNIAIEFRWGEGKIERVPDLAAELVNLKMAKALGLTIPQSVLVRADHVIQ